MSLGAGALKAGGAGRQFWHRERSIHCNPASSHHPATITTIQSVENLPIPSSYPWEGGLGKKSSANIGKQSANVNGLKGQQASKQAKKHEVPLLI